MISTHIYFKYLEICKSVTNDSEKIKLISVNFILKHGLEIFIKL